MYLHQNNFLYIEFAQCFCSDRHSKSTKDNYVPIKRRLLVIHRKTLLSGLRGMSTSYNIHYTLSKDTYINDEANTR